MTLYIGLTLSSKSKEYRNAAMAYPKEKVLYKNHFYSAEGLDGVVAMAGLLIPLLRTISFIVTLHKIKARLCSIVFAAAQWQTYCLQFHCQLWL